MKFKIEKKLLSKNIEKIKKSKAFNKTDGENIAILKIKVEKDKILLLCSNIGIWACSIIEQKNDSQEKLEIIEEGEVFVDGTNFINIVNTYPIDSMLEFKDTKEEDGNNRLVLNYKKDKNEKQSAFLIIDPDYFEKEPPKEEKKEMVVNTQKLVDSIKSVGFASSTNELERWMWGVMVEVYDKDDIAAYATDRTKIAWYDEKGHKRNLDKVPFIIMPIYSCIEPVLDCLDKEIDSTIHYGKNYTVISQKNQWHAIPNAIESNRSEEKFPDWRSLHEKIISSTKTKIKIDKQIILQCIKTASYTSCKRYGIKITINTKNKNIDFAVDSTEVGGILKSYHKESYSLRDEDIEGEEFSDEITMSIDFLKEALNKYNSKVITMCLIDGSSPLIIEGESSEFLKLITTGLE